MYLSQLLIDTGADPDRLRPGRLWLRNLYHVHQRLCMAFPSDQRTTLDPEFLAPYKAGDFPEQHHLADRKKEEVGQDILEQVHSPRNNEAGFLFRIDPLPNGRAVILVQTAIKPDWGYAFHNADYLLAAPPEVKLFEPCFSQGQRLRFRLVANPTRKIDTKSGPDGKRRNGRRVPVRDEQLMDWIDSRAENAGFALDEASVSIEPGYANFEKGVNGGEKCRLRTALYDGILTVTDPTCFAETLVRGIGPAKAYGFGMLSVAP